MICTVSHRASTEHGFKYFEAGKDYDPTEVGDRGHFFEQEKPPEAVEEKPPKRAKKNEKDENVLA
jgi:hypothetical protein